jgi:uroporphyrinogen decarboxylase
VAALAAIAASQANFAKRCIQAGADGIYLSVRDDWVNTVANGPSTYDELVRTGDGQILAAARDARFNVLHVCGVPQDLEGFADYPVDALSWADRAAGLHIAAVAGRIRPAICGGVNNLHTLPNGTPADVEAEVLDAIRQAGSHPIIVAPGCTYDPSAVPTANLEALRNAVRA